MGTDAIWAMLVATLLGLLIGLERERKREKTGTLFAGVRTFTLISLFGSVSGLLLEPVGAWPLTTSFLAITVMVALGYWRESSGTKVGATTEIAALVTFGLGVLAGMGWFSSALAGAVIVTGVLSLREELHGLVFALSREDLLAVVRFAAVSLLVLPLVPDEQLGPWGVWNPRTIWLLVVLISGVSFVGYVAVKLVGTRRGIGLTGLLGGLASSTAATLSFSERGRDHPELAPVLSVGALGATAVAGPRLLVLLAVVGPELVPYAAVPLGALFAASTVAALLVSRNRDDAEGELHVENPFRLRTALQFGLLFAAVLLLTRAAQEWLGDSGLLVASAIAGITQLDAITLSLADQTSAGLDPVVAGRGLGLAVLANNLFKGGLAVSVAGGSFGRTVLGSLAVVGALAAAAAWWLVPMIA